MINAGGPLQHPGFPHVKISMEAIARWYTWWSILFLLILDIALGTRLKYIKFYMAPCHSMLWRLSIIW